MEESCRTSVVCRPHCVQSVLTTDLSQDSPTKERKYDDSLHSVFGLNAEVKLHSFLNHLPFISFSRLFSASAILFLPRRSVAE